ncbi:MAG: TIGR02391 family protein [bacterium]
MSQKPKKSEPVEANLSFQQMQAAIPKIDRRIKDLENLDINSITKYGDPTVLTLEKTLEATLASIFGTNTVEYERYRHGVTSLNPGSWWPDITLGEIKQSVSESVTESRQQLEGIKAIFLEELGDAGQTSSGKTLKAYEGLELHPAIERAVGNLFKDGHYSNAIEDAVKALNALVRMNSGIDDKDGIALMEFVFSSKSPVLKFNTLADTSDIDEQKGFMMMFSGAVAGLRNPRAHKIIKDDPEMALEFIAFVSLLAKLADKSSK